MSGEYLNNLRAFLLGGDGAPVGAPDGLLATSGLTIEQLAHACGITRTAIYSYIERKSRPTTPTLRRIAQALGVRFDQALGYCTPAQVGRPPRGDLRPMRPSETTSPEVVVARQASRGIRRGAYDRRSEAQKERQKFQRQELFRTIKRPNSNERGGAGQEGFRMKEDSNLPARGSSSRVFALELKRLMSKHDPPLDLPIPFRICVGLRTLRSIGGRCFGPVRWATLRILPFRQVAKLSLLRMAQEPKWLSHYQFELRTTAAEDSSEGERNMFRFPMQISVRSPDFLEPGLTQKETLHRIGAPDLIRRSEWDYDFFSQAAFTARVFWDESHLEGLPYDEHKTIADEDPPRIPHTLRSLSLSGNRLRCGTTTSLQADNHTWTAVASIPALAANSKKVKHLIIEFLNRYRIFRDTVLLQHAVQLQPA